jgi:hypothetical protein
MGLRDILSQLKCVAIRYNVRRAGHSLPKPAASAGRRNRIVNRIPQLQAQWTACERQVRRLRVWQILWRQQPDNDDDCHLRAGAL